MMEHEDEVVGTEPLDPEDELEDEDEDDMPDEDDAPQLEEDDPSDMTKDNEDEPDPTMNDV